MMPLICPSCGGRMNIEAERKLVPFSCPYCKAGLVPEKNGQAVVLKAATNAMSSQPTPASPSLAQDPVPYLKQAQEESDPVKRYALLIKAEEAAPKDLRVQKALLLHGRLHERDRRKVDFSVIKCYLLHIFEEPQAYSSDQLKQKMQALWEEDRLKKAMSLTDHPQAFLQEYLIDLSKEYIHLFLQGSSRHMRPIFGFAPAGKPQKLLAEPVASMIRQMLFCEYLTKEQQGIISHAFYEGFAQEFQGETMFLNDALGDILAQVKD